MRAPIRRLVRRPGEPSTPRRATGAFAARLVGSVVGLAGITLMGAGTLGNPAGAFAATSSAGSSNTDSYTCPTGYNACAGQSGQSVLAESMNNPDVCDAVSHTSSEDVWHFVLPTNDDAFVPGTFVAVFDRPTDDATTTASDVTLAHTGKFAYVVWPAGAELDFAYAHATIGGGDTTTAVTFQLSSTCAGETSTTSSTSSQSQTSSTGTTSGDTSTSSSTHSTTSDDTSTSSSTRSTTSTTQTHTATDPCTSAFEDDDHVTCTTSSSDSTSSTSHASTNTSSSSSQTSSSSSSASNNSSNTSSTSQSTSDQSSTSHTSNVSDPTTSVSSQSNSTSTNPSQSGVLGAATTTPSTGADVEFGFGIALLLGGAGVMIGATRINRNKQG